MLVQRSMRLALATLILGLAIAGYASHVRATYFNVLHPGADSNCNPDMDQGNFGPGKSVQYRKSGVIILTSNAIAGNLSGSTQWFPNLGREVHNP